jgi:hypothetical protein
MPKSHFSPSAGVQEQDSVLLAPMSQTIEANSSYIEGITKQ